jgi:hypothetical protein
MKHTVEMASDGMIYVQSFMLGTASLQYKYHYSNPKLKSTCQNTGVGDLSSLYLHGIS